ncbi:HupE/UreJ family protein [Alloyangia pacifica]|uniref:HupE/UreJ family protein n=1 Tax=Alloyangia pacifica TaxID=311180 RepID=UPI001CFEA09F|nr:HupE/UreJ family protein [Alloyangia pacifica]
MLRTSHRLGLAALGLLAPLPAHAHHAMGGELPTNALESAISGLAHPVIGIDHLAFVVLVGLLAARSGQRLALSGSFAAATVVGCLLLLAGVTLPLTEVVIGGSVVALGAVLLRAELPKVKALGIVVPVIGLFHGWAYGEAILGAETGVIPAYLLGFGLVQFAIAAGVATLVVAARESAGLAATRERITAAACMGIGCAVMIETVEAMVFTV